MITAIVPIRGFHEGKTRLEDVLTEADRFKLIQSMASNVVNALDKASIIDRVVIVTKDHQVVDYFETHFNSEKISGLIEKPSDDLNSALEGAIASLDSNTNDKVLLMHGDLPLISPEAVEFFVRHHEAGLLINPCHLGLGTNAIVMNVSKRVPLQFGEGSFQKHLVSADSLEMSTRIVSIPAIAIDMDTKSDWVTLQTSGLGTDCPHLFDRLLTNNDNGYDKR